MVCSFQYPPENALTYGTMAQLELQPQSRPRRSRPRPPRRSTTASRARSTGSCSKARGPTSRTPTVKAYYEKLSTFVEGHGERRLLGRSHLPGRARVLPAGHREGRHARPGEDRRGHADRALQDHHERRHLHDQPDPRQSPPTPARSASGRTGSRRSSTRTSGPPTRSGIRNRPGPTLPRAFPARPPRPASLESYVRAAHEAADDLSRAPGAPKGAPRATWSS